MRFCLRAGFGFATTLAVGAVSRPGQALPPLENPPDEGPGYRAVRSWPIRQAACRGGGLLIRSYWPEK
jgi:hypothetical protein